MENSLIGAISAGVICGVLFCITIAVVCYLIYRCRLHEDEKSSQHDLLINGHVPNGVIPSVTQMVPIAATSPSRQVYQFPTMPVRHMASYRPRYIEERNPAGMPDMERHTVVGKSQTYSGPYTIPVGPVFYDVRQHGGARSGRSPVWAERGQEESVATMTLGEESPKLSERQLVLEENNNTSVKSNEEHTTVEKRSSRIEEFHFTSPDAARKGYLFTEQDQPKPPTPPISDTKHNTNTIPNGDASKEVDRKVIRESSRRQRRGEDGSVIILPPPDYD